MKTIRFSLHFSTVEKKIIARNLYENYMFWFIEKKLYVYFFEKTYKNHM